MNSAGINGILSDAPCAVRTGDALCIASRTGGYQVSHGSPAISNRLTSEEIETLQQKLEELRLEHRDLDDVINHLSHSAYPDQLQLKRLKKRKLRLKDTIQLIESRLIPDIDA
jgi:hypothetical protein